MHNQLDHLSTIAVLIAVKVKLEIAQSEQDVSPFCKESDMTYS